ncbi:MAG TPA: FAD-binding oxidoreductase [Woeseiaceae bacterium]|nr:FAD-binding oxidoreductase [Woeseiaceae bacterium]
MDFPLLLERLKAIVGPGGWTSDAAALLPHLTEWRDRYHGKTPLMVSPGSTEQVAAVVKACGETGVAIVPQGGNTGLCGGAIPHESGREILVSMGRLNRIRSISPLDYALVAEAGCVLANVQAAAVEAGRFFPLSLSAEGSCQIGGNLSTNAGGINVLRYGNARDQVLGLEVVLPDGRIWNGLRALRKDTAGYDLKQLFIGAEGTLGIITAATLRLYPPVGNTHTAFVAMANVEAAIELLSFLREAAADSLLAFELIQQRALQFVVDHIPSARNPFGSGHPWYALLEMSGAAKAESFESMLADAVGKSLVEDAVVAKNEAEAKQLWRLRHSISEAQKYEGASLKHDISVPLGKIGEFIRKAEAAVIDKIPDARVVAFGHVGDGNVHFNVSQPGSWSAERFLEQRSAIADIVYDVTAALNGSISAEHGIGRAKREHLRRYRSDTELSLMRAVKKALDPMETMNPGKVL